MIAFDNAQTVNDSVGTTWSHTCNGNNRLLLVGIVSGLFQNNADPTTVTYAGVAMTKIAELNYINDSFRKVFLYALLNPAQGANNIVVSFNGNAPLTACSASYTGVKQTGNPEAFATSTNGGSDTQTLALAVSTLTKNAWVVGFSWWFGGQNYSVTSSPGTIRTQDSGATNRGAMYDSNGPIATPQSFSMTIHVTSSANNVQMINVALAPAPDAGGGALLLMAS